METASSHAAIREKDRRAGCFVSPIRSLGRWSTLMSGTRNRLARRIRYPRVSPSIDGLVCENSGPKDCFARAA